jgi:hypothetical protein
MMFSRLPKRRKHPKMGIRKQSQLRSDGHLRWIRGHCCCVENKDCRGPICAAHVRVGTDGGTCRKCDGSGQTGDGHDCNLCDGLVATGNPRGSMAEFERKMAAHRRKQEG